MNLSEMSKKELYRLAVELNVENRSKMTREELAAALTAAMSEQKVYSSTEQHKAEVAHSMPEKVRPAEYPIPNRYQIDTAVLLPINPRKEYVYWEVSDNTVNRFRTEHGSPDAAFVLKIFGSTSGEDSEELASVRVGRYGNWFFDLYVPERLIWAEIGLMDNKGNYFAVAHSRKVRMPSDKISEIIDEETWMTVGEKIEDIYRLSGVNELDSSVPGSVRIFQEAMRFLEKSVSSGETAKREGR
ncbi:DUF4912 domain-containing protein [Geovibrio ferrireducens]|uniref:DUF4912 domain-containing protein n=1 Tax=Geovibrio ferrireducens TaxID=46201 RepID=UPI0022481B68|nr:DUF4912 domain-containing protein [Geovibrio ferrireducens]